MLEDGMREEQTKCPAAGGLLCRPGDRFVSHRRPPPPPPARRTHQRSAQPDGGRDRACYRPRHCLQDECRWRPAPAHGDRRASRSTAPTVAATAPASAPPRPNGTCRRLMASAVPKTGHPQLMAAAGRVFLLHRCPPPKTTAAPAPARGVGWSCKEGVGAATARGMGARRPGRQIRSRPAAHAERQTASVAARAARTNHAEPLRAGSQS